jgi:flagellar assembly protein FliH
MPSFSPEHLAPRPRATFVPQPLPATGGAPRGGPAPAALAPPAPCGPVPGPDALRAAREEGFAAGREAGLREGREQGDRAALHEALGPALEALEEAARGLAALRRSYLREQRGLVVELALEVSARLLAREVAADADALAGVLERALAALGEEPALRVRLSPGDLARVERGLAPRLAALASGAGLAFEAAPELAPGDVRVQAARSEVDARRAELLRRVRAELDEALEGEGEPA